MTKYDSIRVLSVGHLLRTRWEMASHAHGMHELIVVVKGRMTVRSPRETVSGRAGEVLLYPAGLQHHEWSEGGDSLETFYISFEMAGVAQVEPLLASDPEGRMRQIARWLYADRHEAGMAVASHRDCLMGAVVAEFHRNRDSGEVALVKSVREFIHARVGERLTLELLAARFGLSKFHFLREYKRLSGRTPLDEVRRIRADHARELIMSTSLPFKEIAPMCGLGTEFAMCRLFRKLCGMTPGEIRRFGSR